MSLSRWKAANLGEIPAAAAAWSRVTRPGWAATKRSRRWRSSSASSAIAAIACRPRLVPCGWSKPQEIWTKSTCPWSQAYNQHLLVERPCSRVRGGSQLTKDRPQEPATTAARTGQNAGGDDGGSAPGTSQSWCWDG